MCGITSNNALYHHGIKGQKWGVRRFQNEDGSLTKEGKERYRNPKYENADGSYTEEGREHYAKSALKQWSRLQTEEQKLFDRIRKNQGTVDDLDHYKEQIEYGRQKMNGWKHTAEYILNAEVPTSEDASKVYDQNYKKMLSVESKLWDMNNNVEDMYQDIDPHTIEQAQKEQKKIDDIVRNDLKAKELYEKEKKLSEDYDHAVKSKQPQEQMNLLMKIYDVSDDRREAQLWAAYSYVMSKYPEQQAEIILGIWFAGGDWMPT